MDDQYIALISGFVGALVGAGASLLTVWIQARHWLKQQRWSHREKHYLELLSSLNRLKLSLEDRSEYYDEPSSEHDASRSEGEHFKELSQTGYEALRAVREQIGPASVFLSTNATSAVEKLIREHWHTSQGSVCTAEYVRSSLSLATDAYLALLEEARKELADVQGA